MNSPKLSVIFKDHIFIQILVWVTITVGVILIQTRGLPSGDENLGNVLINAGNQSRMFEGEIVPGMTMLDAIYAAAGAGNLKFNYSVDSQNSTQIKALGDLENAQNKYIFLLNSRVVAAEDLNRIYINPGDKITITLAQASN